MIFVRVADVDWVEASADYVSIHVGNKAWLVRETIASIASSLRGTWNRQDSPFDAGETRPCHGAGWPLANGEFTVVLRDGKELENEPQLSRVSA